MSRTCLCLSVPLLLVMMANVAKAGAPVATNSLSLVPGAAGIAPEGKAETSRPTPERAATWFAQAAERGLPASGVLLVVSVSDQRLAVVLTDGCRGCYPVSTSRWGIGAEQDSRRTPPGWHRVADRLGAGARPGQVFVSRRPTREVLPASAWQAEETRDGVLTRILRLQGLEDGVNRGRGIDSYARYIYLHGTNQEQLLGQPASQGCVRLANRDVMELFDLTRERETYCWIVASPLAVL